MALKNQVIDRVPTYPGRVVLTPVSGQINTYDMARNDSPLVDGTPINAHLLNRKADVLIETVTVYVNGSQGNDSTGDGSSGAPYATIQKAVDSLPKNLGSFGHTIDISAGTYNEVVNVDGFYGGRLTLGIAGVAVTIRGLSVVGSSFIQVNIPTITYNSLSGERLIYISEGSVVQSTRRITMSAGNANVNCVHVEQGATYLATSGLSISNTIRNAVLTQTGATVYVSELLGSGNMNGLRAESGSFIGYGAMTMTATTSTRTNTGGQITTGSQGNLATAEVI